MKCNVGVVDRTTRALVGIILILSGQMVQSPLLHRVLPWMGGALLVTAVFAWCPLYYGIGFTTRPKTSPGA